MQTLYACAVTVVKSNNSTLIHFLKLICLIWIKILFDSSVPQEPLIYRKRGTDMSTSSHRGPEKTHKDRCNNSIPRYERGSHYVTSLSLFEISQVPVGQDEHNASFISNKSSPTRRYGMRRIRGQRYYFCLIRQRNGARNFLIICKYSKSKARLG